jgi:signal transduction histidine kinase
MQAVLTVKDHGFGIPKDVLDRFGSSASSGVGLAGMRESIRELGGTFEVESGNTGTSVRVTVPLKAGQLGQYDRVGSSLSRVVRRLRMTSVRYS